MSTFEIWLLAVSLAMDCFSVSITSGIILRRICWRTFLTMAFFFGLFQGIMPLIGWFGASRFYSLIEQFDHWIAFGLLAFIGINMLKEAFGKEEECCCCDEHNADLSVRTMFIMAVATSIDALAVGSSVAMAGNVNIFLAAVFIGICTCSLSAVGVKGGNVFGSRYEKKAQLAGGVILILLGLKILLEGLEILP